MRELLTLGVGQAGTQVRNRPTAELGLAALTPQQVSSAFWESLVKEHGLDEEGVSSSLENDRLQA